MIIDATGIDQRNGRAVEIILYQDIIDVCIDNRRCIINRCPEQRGERIYFYARAGDLLIEDVKVEEITL